MTDRRRLFFAALGIAAAAAVSAPSVARAALAVDPPPTLSAFETLTDDHAPPAPALAAAETMQPGPTATEVRTRGGLSAAARSLAIPGWGQLYSGHKTQAAVFGLLELGTWVAFATYRRQGSLRQSSSFDTARLYAGIDLEGKPEELRRLVGQYQSSDVYNQYVVLREATFFIADPAERATYIAENSIPPDQAWSWSDFDDYSRYVEERRTSELSYQRSRYLLGFALVNRLISAIAAARTAPVPPEAQAAAPPGQLRGHVEWGLVPGKTGVPESRLAYVMGF